MPKVRYLKVTFANHILAREVPCFRSAVIEATERQSSLFHNHKPDSSSIYRYPLIQYKSLYKKASIICLNEGTDDIHYLFQRRDLDLRIGDREETFEIEDIHLKYFNVQCWQGQFEYALKDWQALNQDNYKRYMALDTEVERLQFLEKLLLGNLLAFAKGIGWDVQGQLEARITRMKGERWLPYKGHKSLCFSLNFRCNASLPNFIGLGKGGSVGYGSLLEIGNKKPGSMKYETRNANYEQQTANHAQQ